MALGDAADGGVAGHLRDEVEVEREERRAQAHARGGHGGFAAGVACADDDYVVLFGESEIRWVAAEFQQCSGRAIPEQPGNDDVGIENQPHQPAERVRRSARIAAISTATSSGDMKSGSSTAAIRSMAANNSSRLWAFRRSRRSSSIESEDSRPARSASAASLSGKVI
jgi:hypothetical protein